MELNADLLKRMVRDILDTQNDDIDCDGCFDHIDRFVDLELAGKNAVEAMPVVAAHLEHCHDCLQEHDALLAAVRSLL